MRPRSLLVSSPLVLVRYPGLLLAIAGAGVILAAAAAASPLFVSSAGNATLRKGIQPLCPWGVALSVNTTFFDPETDRTLADAFGDADRQIRAKVNGLHTGSGVATIFLGQRVDAWAVGRPQRRGPIQLIFREGALRNVHTLASSSTEGLWITDTTAEALGAEVGDRLMLDAGAERKARVLIAGIYRDLAKGPIPTYWCSLSGSIIPSNAFALFPPPPPPVALADRTLVFDLAKRFSPLAQFAMWEFPIDQRGLTLEQARPASDALERIGEELSPATGNAACGVLGCISSHTDMPAIVERADRTVSSLRGPVAAVSWSGRLLALSLLAGAAVYWTVRRRTETALLSARGVGPQRIGARVLAESLVPLIIAAAIGWGGAVWGVRLLGPSSVIDRSALRAAVEITSWMTVAGVILLSTTVALLARRSAESFEAHRRLRVQRIPWDVVLAALAGASLYELTTRGTGPVTSTTGKLQLDVLVLLFPILFTAAGTGLVARGLAVLLPRAARRRSGGSPALYLALRRLGTSGVMAVGLVAAVAMGAGVLSYSGVVGSSLSATQRAKSEVFTGSDLSADVSEVSAIPPSLTSRATHVKRISIATFLGMGRMPALAVDPLTFDRAAFWDPSFSDRSLRTLLADMSKPQANGRLPILVSGIHAPATGRILIGYGFGGFQEARVVGQPSHFPGSDPGRPLMIVPLDAPQVDEAPGNDQFWVRGDPADGERRLRAAGILIFRSVTADQVEQTADLASLAWAFGFLLALGVVTALIAVVGAVLYLQARQRGRTVAHALAHRMGLSKGELRLSVALELAVLLATGVALGLGLGLIAARLVVVRLDPVPYLAPAMLLRIPLRSWVVVALTAGAMALVGGWAAQLAADRANVATSLRTSV